MADDFKYHIEQHGSLVRPPSLLAAHSNGLTGDDLAAIEEDAIIGTAHLQRRLTLSMVGDGQFRRSCFESVVYDHVIPGVSHPGHRPKFHHKITKIN
jgi:5-methyltetrahydropteroyltriglutamate--homocysteine methyltransferase